MGSPWLGPSYLIEWARKRAPTKPAIFNLRGPLTREVPAWERVTRHRAESMIRNDSNARLDLCLSRRERSPHCKTCESSSATALPRHFYSRSFQAQALVIGRVTRDAPARNGTRYQGDPQECPSRSGSRVLPAFFFMVRSVCSIPQSRPSLDHHVTIELEDPLPGACSIRKPNR